MNCKNCGAVLENGVMFCPSCGARTDTAVEGVASGAGEGVYCKKCGMEIFPEDTFCPSCGSPVNSPVEENDATVMMDDNKLKMMYEYNPHGYNNSAGGYGSNNSFGNNQERYNGYNNGNYNTTVRQKDNNSVIIAIIIAVAVIILAAGGAAFYIFANNNSSSDSSDTNTPVENGDLIDDTTMEPVKPNPSSRGYIYDTDRKYITASELSYYTRDEVRLILNEMYARHGYIFSTPEYQAYFDAQSWYYGTTTSQDAVVAAFNSYEKANHTTIVNYEKSMGWR